MSEPLGEFMNRSLLCTRACFNKQDLFGRGKNFGGSKNLLRQKFGNSKNIAGKKFWGAKRNRVCEL